MKSGCFCFVVSAGMQLATMVSGQTPPPRQPTAAELRRAAQPGRDNTWWKHAIIYEIYPRSFQDSNGDGVGDLNGITQRLDYLRDLGVDVIWIAPMFPSPQIDFGYDVSDFLAVDPQYGTLADMDRLIAEAKKRNIRVCLDWVLNHTSDKHRWFEESAASRTNPKADWYVWNDGIKSGPSVSAFQRRYEHDGMVPPNNWQSKFGGSAWQWVPARKQFYYHRFYVQQPDLNYRNPAVEKAMFDGMRFWLDRGIAGFRLDAVPSMFEDAQLRDDPETGGTNEFGDPNVESKYNDNLPEVHSVLVRMRRLIDKYPGDRLLIGETYLPGTAEIDKWYGGTLHNELQLPMDTLVGIPRKGHTDLNATYLRKYITEAETELHGAQPLLVFDNHDRARSHDRYGDGVHNDQIDKVIAALLLTSKAAALIYYGEELGMVTTTPTDVSRVKDPIGITGWPKEKGRDGERTPMQWDGSPQSGFSTNAHTWLPIPQDYLSLNATTEGADPNSLLNWHKKLIALRRKNRALHDGGIVMLDTSNPNVLSYVRTGAPGIKPVVVSLNMSPFPQTVNLDLSAANVAGTRVIPIAFDSAGLAHVTSVRDLALPPYGSFIAEVQ